VGAPYAGDGPLGSKIKKFALNHISRENSNAFRLRRFIGRVLFELHPLFRAE
jgi:hypothetical protein